MLEYGLPAAPEGHRWYIRRGLYDQARRYLHLEKKVVSRWRKKVSWVSVRDEYIVQPLIDRDGFESAVRKEAKQILHDLNVNFHLPTGEVR